MSHSEEKINEVAGVLRVLGHPDRLRILVCLLKDKCFVMDLCAKLDMPQSTVSQHLRVMTDRGILVSVRDGVKVCYRPADSLPKDLVELVVSLCDERK